MIVTIFNSAVDPQGEALDMTPQEFLLYIADRVRGTCSGYSLEEYEQLTDRERLNVKSSNGGFIPGSFINCRRSKENLRSRSALVLDLDDGIENIQALLNKIGNSYIAYTTPSSKPEAPRLRIILPVSRELTGSEYERLGRAYGPTISPTLDSCSWRPAQLMFFPVRHTDTKPQAWYNFERPTLDPDEWLGTAEATNDLEDIFSVPSKAGESHYKSPSQYKGIRGQFNASVDGMELMSMILDTVYEPAGAGRYRYIGSESIAGVIFNESSDKIYSHHSSDPMADGRFHDFWDACRIHLFHGDWKKMNRFARAYLELKGEEVNE